MEVKRLGIYLRKDSATVVNLSLAGKERKILSCFTVSVEDSAEQSMSGLANLIGQGCAKRGLEFSEAGVALDCGMFMQHNIHSEFTDSKQIAATVRFDAEEALATDVSDISIAFKVTSSDSSGSEIAVFTAKKDILSDVIESLQSNNIDPVTVEPDVHCLSKFITQNISLAEQSYRFFTMLSDSNGYFVIPTEYGKSTIMRTFLLGSRRDRGEVLSREVPLTKAFIEMTEPVKSVEVFDSSDSVDCSFLSEKVGMEVNRFDLAGSLGIEEEKLGEFADMVAASIGYGAALLDSEKSPTIDLRSDFMPYLGKRIRLQKAAMFLSISLTVLMMALGIYSQIRLHQTNKPLKAIRSQFKEDYAAVMLGKSRPAKAKEAVSKLSTELRRIKNVKSGQLSMTGEKSISAKLTMVLSAFNKCASRTDLKIEKISITSKNIRILGNTSSRKNTLSLRKAIEQSGLKISNDSAESKGGRDIFVITVTTRN